MLIPFSFISISLSFLVPNVQLNLHGYNQPTDHPDSQVKNGHKTNVNSQKNKVTLSIDDKTLAIVERNVTTKAIVNCSLYDLEKYVDAIEKSMVKYSQPVVPCDFNVMTSLIEECSRLPVTKAASRSTRDVLDNQAIDLKPVNGELEVTFNSSDIQSLWRGIIPGTKWCGLGDEAQNYNDLGEYGEVDSCCRAHDHCPTRMKAFGLDYGIINFSLYTKSHCRCDEAFFNCLKATKSALGDLIGNFYFNIMKTSCIDDAQPCQSKLDPLCSDSILFKGRSSSTPKVIFVPSVLIY